MIKCREYSNCHMEDLDIVFFKNLKIIAQSMIPHSLGIKKYIYLGIRLIHISGILFMYLGIFLPKDFRQYHIIFCLFNLLCWRIFNNKCYISLFIKFIFNLPEYPEFIPSNMNSTQKVTFIVLFISLVSMVYPKKSLYNLLGDFRQYMNKFN
jgi:hypothetical protein